MVIKEQDSIWKIFLVIIKLFQKFLYKCIIDLKKVIIYIIIIIKLYNVNNKKDVKGERKIK